MLCKRIIPCLDVKDGRTVKGKNFENLADAGDPVALATAYYRQGADEIVFLDITASSERRGTMIRVARDVATEVFVPFTIGGGIRGIRDIERLLKAGADKVSINTSAIEKPELIADAAKEFGSQAIVVAIDAKWDGRCKIGKWRVYKKGGKEATGLDAISWARRAERLGAGEILLTSIDRDGTRKGFDLRLTKAIADAVSIPVIASGGAGSERDFLDVFRKTKASAVLAAGLFHYGNLSIPELKKYLRKKGVEIRENENKVR